MIPDTRTAAQRLADWAFTCENVNESVHLHGTAKDDLARDIRDVLAELKFEHDKNESRRRAFIRPHDLREQLDMLRNDYGALAAKNTMLRTALEDALSTFRHDDKETVVTAERQEAWRAALEGHQ